MRRIAAALLVSALVGYLGGSVAPSTAASGYRLGAQGAPATRGAQRAVSGRWGGMDRRGAKGTPRATEPAYGAELHLTEAQADRLGSPPSNISPVANPPLYPDEPNRPMHWSVDDLRKIHAARLALQRANPERPTQGGGGALPPGTPTFQGQRFRTHNIGTNFRAYYEQERPANLTGVMSHYDDVEQHEGVSDFYVITGGGGRMVVDGTIENREYRRASGNSGSTSILLPGEFDGQPIKNGSTYTVKPGDWLAIPPNDPHWQLPTPNEGLSYLLLKVNIGLYPGSIAR